MNLLNLVTGTFAVGGAVALAWSIYSLQQMWRIGSPVKWLLIGLFHGVSSWFLFTLAVYLARIDSLLRP